MATLNPQYHYLRDSLEIIREDDGTNYKTDTTHYVDCGLAGPDGAGNRAAQYQKMDLVIDFSGFVSDDGADAETLEVSLILNSSESESGAVIHRLRLYDNDDNGMTGRVVIPIHNFDLDTLYRYVGFKFDFAVAAGLDVKWGAFVSKC